MERISVKDGLPKKKSEYLCCYRIKNGTYKYAGFLTYYPHLEKFQFEDEKYQLNVTHWMELPGLPEE